MTKFEGFEPAARTWFTGLEADNSREYFAAHREFYEHAIRARDALASQQLDPLVVLGVAPRRGGERSPPQLEPRLARGDGLSADLYKRQCLALYS
jgi:hypothetical protein